MANIKLLYLWLKTGLEKDPSTGLYVSEILNTYNFCARLLSDDLSLQANTFAPLLEGFIIGLDWKSKFEDRKGKGGRLLKGVTYKQKEYIVLHEIVNIGVLTNPATFNNANSAGKAINNLCKATADNENIQY